MNISRDDARERVNKAAIGSLANTSHEYLIALKEFVHQWTLTIDSEIKRTYAAAKWPDRLDHSCVDTRGISKGPNHQCAACNFDPEAQ